MNELAKQALDKYLKLMNDFIYGNISTQRFEAHYLETFKNETVTFDEKIYSALNNLFLDLDMYCEDESIRDEDDIDKKELLKRVKSHLATLRLGES